jgi:hypothetical protein
MPKNTYGEFPFLIVYEVDGERFTVRDSLICEYIGREANTTRGKYIKWNERLASGHEDQFVAASMSHHLMPGNEWQYGCSIRLLDSVVVSIDSPSGGYVGEINIDIGSPQYYLGYYSLDDYSPGEVFTNRVLSKDELWDLYGIKIIEAEFSPPMIGNGIVPKTRR